ncbi:MAG: hypothetical protein AAF938_30415 [Myxococcota bacterium]
MDTSSYGFRCRDDYRRLVEWAEANGRLDPSAPLGGQCIELDEGVDSLPTNAAGDANQQIFALCRDISQLYGTGRLWQEIQDGAEAGDMNGWHHRFLPIAYPIGQTYSGDVIVQAVATGKIYFSNHETWSDTQFINSADADERAELEEEIEDAMEELGIESVGNLAPEQVLALMTHDSLDALTCIADDVDQLLAIIQRARS